MEELRYALQETSFHDLEYEDIVHDEHPYLQFAIESGTKHFVTFKQHEFRFLSKHDKPCSTDPKFNYDQVTGQLYIYYNYTNYQYYTLPHAVYI